MALLSAALCVGSFAAFASAAPDGESRKSKKNRDESDRGKSSNGSASSPEALQRATKAVRSGDYTAARKMIRSALDATRSTSVRQSWQILEAELEFSLKKYAKAGLIVMRIVVLTPESEQIGPALFRAGRVYEKLDRPEKAIELYRECAAHKKVSESLKKKAERRIAALEPAEKS